MDDKKLFSQYYFPNTTRNEDSEKFRGRILKYIEDFLKTAWPDDVYRLCRSRMAIDIDRNPRGGYFNYHVEKTFYSKEIKDILDFVSIVYDSLISYSNDPNTRGLALPKLNAFTNEINIIFQEESMCYVLNENGRVRYYPDEEFHQAVKSTLAVLNKPKYQSNLEIFNNVLDDLYKNPNKESPIEKLFKCIEIFSLSLLNNESSLKLDQGMINKLIEKISGHLDEKYTINDKRAISELQNLFYAWVKMSHKSRHGKANQLSDEVPSGLFNFIFSTGISIFRFLLEMDDKYNLIPEKK